MKKISDMLGPLPANPRHQHGALLLATLIILLIISLLGMATVDNTGLEMKMSSNSRQQQIVFEAAEYTLSWVENTLHNNAYFTDNQLSNSSCGSTCFSSACTNGYCFNGSSPTSVSSCLLSVPSTEPYADSTIWATGSNKYQTLSIASSGLTTKYIVEYWCYTAIDPQYPKTDPANAARMFRITTLATSADGHVRVMLRSVIRAI